MTRTSCVISAGLCVAMIVAQAAGQDTKTDAAIASGLAYLSKGQNYDGSFGERKTNRKTTALSLLAFLSTGNTADGGRYAGNVRRATEFLLRQSPPGEAISIDERAVVLLALCREYGTEPDEATRIRIRAIAKDSIAAIVAAQDQAATEWCRRALQASQRIGLNVPKEAADRAKAATTNASTQPDSDALIASQQDDGSWPAEGAGSQIDATALALLGLAEQLKLQ